MKKIALLWLITFSFISVNAQEPYYSDVDLEATGAQLKENLATKIINTHTNFLDYTPGVWEASKITDVNPENSAEVLLIYGFSTDGKTSKTRGINQNGGTRGRDWNREHTYAQSLGTPALGRSVGAGVDAHHLRPSDVGFNSDRGSLKFVNGSGNAGPISGGWYPGDEWKGDVARMMMYMYLHYNTQCLPTNVGVGNSSATEDAMINLFLEWNAEDPVSDFERQRNTYHDSNKTYAQGNRNPFIDNAYLATRIWGGTAAEDSWGIYTSNDTIAPTAPTNVALSNVTRATIDATWTAATDNEAVTKYEIYANNVLNGETATTSYTLINLTPNTAYDVTVIAKDLGNNESPKSTIVSATTLADTTAPTVPTNVIVSNETGTSFKVSWTAATDNTAVTGYDVFIDGTLNGTATSNTYTVTNLTVSTSYTVAVFAKDASGNTSNQSEIIAGTTTDGSNPIVELFFSEYVEGNDRSSNEKAVEIANFTDNVVDLSAYSIKNQSNGSGPWVNELALSGTVNTKDVFVIIGYLSENATLVAEADLVAPKGSNFGAPLNPNGNDPIGLFKNGTLIDVIGVFNETTSNFKDMTLRRKITVTAPNAAYTGSEWEQFAVNTFNGIGKHSSATASVAAANFSNFSMYPNPTNGNTLFFNLNKEATITIYNALGKHMQTEKIDATNKNIDVSKLSKGVYLLKISTNEQIITKKLIKE